MKNFSQIIKKLKQNNEYISVMESCTGGGVCNFITNISGSSDVFKFGVVAYSNDYKIKMGVDENIINKFSVYSKETVMEMATKICEFTQADYGVGITGKLKSVDKANLVGQDDKVYISVYDSKNKKHYDKNIIVPFEQREQNKTVIIDVLIEMLEKIILSK